MLAPKPFLLRVRSNIERYELTVYGGEGILRKTVNTRQKSLCLCTTSPYLRVTARSLVDGYSTTLYLWVNTLCQNAVSLYLNFPPNVTPTTTRNRFTLTDANYGLPIDGVLTFT